MTILVYNLKSMEQNNQPLEEKSLFPGGCANCGHPVVEQGYPTPLCKDCRAKFINFPIPAGIKIFAGVIGVILVIAMFKAPKNFSAGIHYQRGKEAIQKANFLTAQNELTKVIKKIPGFESAKEYLVIASFHNQDMETFAKVMQELVGKKVEEEGLFAEINELTQKASNYFPSDSFMVLFTKYNSFDSIPEIVYRQYITTYADELYPAIRYASLLFDKKRYKSCDSLLDFILQKDRTYFGALSMKTGLKREFGQFDSAHYYCDQILSLNKESAFGISSKARTYLRQKKDKEGMQCALKAFDLDHTDSYSIATLALAYHFNNEPGERDKLIQASKKDSTGMEYMQYVIDVMQGKEKFRE
jgi:predicted Zn-dependent protease